MITPETSRTQLALDIDETSPTDSCSCEDCTETCQPGGACCTPEGGCC